MRCHRLASLSFALAFLLMTQPGPSRLTAEDKSVAKASADQELHIVGLYEGFTRSDGKVHGHKALVNVKRPGKRVTLVLSGHTPLTWEITVEPGTQLEKVILAGSTRQAVKGVPKNAQVTEGFREGRGGNFPFAAYKIDSVAFRVLIEALQRETGHRRAASFHGAYDAKAEVPVVIDRVQDDARLSAEWPIPSPLGDLPRLTFKAGHITPGAHRHDSTTAHGDFTLNGPRKDTLKPTPRGVGRIAFDPAGKKYYGLAGSEVVEFEPGKREVKKIPVSLDVPPLSWPSDVVFDTKRQRLLLIASGCLYSYTPATGNWAVLADGFRALAIAYHPKEDVLYGLVAAHEAPPSLVKFNAEGAVLNSTKLEGPLPPGGISYGPVTAGFQLVHANGWLVLLMSPDGRFRSEEDVAQPRRYIYLIDPASGKARLTWKDPPGAAEEKGAEAERPLRLKAREVQIRPVEVALITPNFTVTIRSKSAPVDAYLVPEEEAAKAAAGLASGKPPMGFVAAVQGVEDEASFTVSLKGKQPLSLVVRNTAARPTEATVTVTSR